MKNGEITLRYLLQPIQPELDDPEVTEIVINRPGEIGIEKNGEWSWRSVAEFDIKKLTAIALLAGRMTNRELDPAHSHAGTTLPDGQRIHICLPPSTTQGIIAMCIRKPPKKARRMEDVDIHELFSQANRRPPRRAEADQKLLSLYHAKRFPEMIIEGVRRRKTIGAVGIMGSGKSDFIRRCVGAVPEYDRIVTIESDPELGDVGPRNKVNLFFNDEQKGRHAIDIVNTTLRMYPKTIAFGEVRGAEGYALLRAIMSGCNVITTWHGPEGGEIDAMCTLLRQHDALRQAPKDQLYEMVRQCFDIIIYFERTIEDGFKARRVWFKSAEEEE